MNPRPPIYFLPALLLAGGPVHAQFWQRLTNPDVMVTMTHPPSLGIKIKSLAFAPVTNENAEELVSACIQDLTASGQIEILDRNNVEKIFKEQKFGQSGLVDARTAVEMGNLMGSPVLLIVKVFRFNVKQFPLRGKTTVYRGNPAQAYDVPVYTSKTQADFGASIQAIDLATGKTYSEKRFALTPSKENSSTDGQPEYPTDSSVREAAIYEVRSDLHKMLLSWKESKKLIFYDDKDYGMKEAFQYLKMNNYPEALAKSVVALNNANADPKVKPKYIARANYNIGMCHFILGDYSSAMPFLQAALKTDPGNNIFGESVGECVRAIALVSEMSKVDTRTAKLEAPAPKAQEPTQNIVLADPKRGTANSGNTTSGNTPSVEDRLKRLNDLKKNGLITQQEYQKRKAEIIKDL